MIVVLGVPVLDQRDDRPLVAGLAGRIALAVAGAGGSVQLVGKVGDDPGGDALLADLTTAGVGHAAVLRDPANPTRTMTPTAGVVGDAELDLEPDDLLAAAALLDAEDAAAAGPVPAEAPEPAPAPGPTLAAPDIELGLRYLVEFGVLIAADALDERAAAAVVEAAAYAGAHVIALVPVGRPLPAALTDATVFEIAPESGGEPDDAFVRLVATYAVALDADVEPGEAFRAAMSGGGWEAATA